MADLAGENLAFPLPEHAVQRVAESIASRSSIIEWVDHKLTALFRYPEDVTDDEISEVREYLLQQEAGFDEVNVKAREEIAPVLLEAGGRATWPTVQRFIDDFWSGEAQLGLYATALWEGWGLPGPAPISELICQEPWRLYFDGWGAAAYARILEHPQRGLVQSADLKQLTYLGAARDRILVSEDKEFRRLGNLVLAGRYPMAEIVPLSEVTD